MAALAPDSQLFRPFGWISTAEQASAGLSLETQLQITGYAMIKG
jgi:hypothetical protein